MVAIENAAFIIEGSFRSPILVMKMEAARMNFDPLLIAGAVIAVVAIGLIALGLLFILGRRQQAVDSDEGLGEDLSVYPPAPQAGSHRLKFEGQFVRIRLVVLASARNVELTADMAEPLLQSVVFGLGDVARADKPRIRIWPPQLSHAGFVPKFFRYVRKPEPEGKPSPWILVAGQAKAGNKPILVGLALALAEPSTRGNVHLDANEWDYKLRIQAPE
jgi:hypothetical protein